MSRQAEYDRWEWEQQQKAWAERYRIDPNDDDGYDKLRDRRLEEGLPAKPNYYGDWSYR